MVSANTFQYYPSGRFRVFCPDKERMTLSVFLTRAMHPTVFLKIGIVAVSLQLHNKEESSYIILPSVFLLSECKVVAGTAWQVSFRPLNICSSPTRNEQIVLSRSLLFYKHILFCLFILGILNLFISACLYVLFIIFLFFPLYQDDIWLYLVCSVWIQT